MTLAKIWRIVIVAGIALTVANCEDGAKFNPFKARDGQENTPSQSGSTRLVARDVEAPDVFQVTSGGLWDGRPSLGGVWIAHPDVKDPERVIIRNQANGKFVIGALFRRERENPGPVLQVSSDAADALGMLAGQPSDLNVTALRRQEVSEQPATNTIQTLDAPETVQETALDPIESAAVAIETATPSAKPTPKPTKPAPITSNLNKPFIQLGIFSVKSNATATSKKMKAAGLLTQVIKSSSSGKTFWRVLVGPATTKSERNSLLKKVKSLGFGDAYFVTN